MNKIMMIISLFASLILINLGVSAKTKTYGFNKEEFRLRSANREMENKIETEGTLRQSVPVPLSTEYGVVLNQIRLLENYSGTSMNVRLEGHADSPDITSHYEDTEYKGVRGLKICIVVDKFSKETDMGAVLDDIHVLEQNTDFMASEISEDNNNLIVKGEVYGI